MEAPTNVFKNYWSTDKFADICIHHMGYVGIAGTYSKLYPTARRHYLYEVTMRNPERIDDFCDKLKEYWHIVPDWRFGQLVSNVVKSNWSETMFYYTEDNKILQMFDEFFGER